MGHRGARRASNHTEHRASRVHDPLLGVGTKPALVALWLYALYPIARNTYTGVRDADIEAVDACEAMGATAIQRLLWVRLPLAAPIILAGVRTAAVITVGAATLAAFIGAGGLGEPIVTGLALADSRLVLAARFPRRCSRCLSTVCWHWLNAPSLPPTCVRGIRSQRTSRGCTLHDGSGELSRPLMPCRRLARRLEKPAPAFAAQQRHRPRANRGAPHRSTRGYATCRRPQEGL